MSLLNLNNCHFLCCNECLHIFPKTLSLAKLDSPLVFRLVSTPFLLGLAILIDMDQRFRFDLDSSVLYLKRALAADGIRIFAFTLFALFAIPLFSLQGIIFAFLGAGILGWLIAIAIHPSGAPPQLPLPSSGISFAS